MDENSISLENQPDLNISDRPCLMTHTRDSTCCSSVLKTSKEIEITKPPPRGHIQTVVEYFMRRTSTKD